MMLRTARSALVLVLALWGAACAPEQPTEWFDGDGYRWRELAVGRRGGPGFTTIAPSRSGVEFQNRLTRGAAMDADHLLIGSGVAIGDYDGDGLPDLYLARLDGDNALFRNMGGWSFVEVTATAGVAASGRYSTGANFVDVDADGHLDLFVTALGEGDALFRNRGDGSFEEVEVGLASALGSTTSTFADVDSDGDLDVYVARYKVESAADVLRPYEQPSVELVVEGPDGPAVAPAYREHFRLEERDGRIVAVEQADVDRLYLNDGTGRFTPVDWSGGRFVDAQGRALEADVDDFGLAAAFADVDDDGDPDLYVCNDFDDPDYLWLNDGAGTFRAADAVSLRTTSHASMAVDFADIDRDGHTDFFVADMLSADPGRRLAQVPLHAAIDKPIGRVLDRVQVGRNTLFLNRGDGTWAQIAEMAGVDGSEWTWGSLFLDVDLDGFEDLLVVNGHGRDMRDGDAFERISGLRGSMTWNEAKSLYPDLPTANMAFRNEGDLRFTDVSTTWGFGVEADVSHGIAVGDLDGDGDLDAVVNRLNMPAAILRNDATAPRVAVRLEGLPPNTGGVGAKVRLIDGAVPLQEREIRSGGLYLSGSQGQATFAASDGLMTLEVEWASGVVSRFHVQSNRLYVVEESGARAVPSAAGADALVAPLFVDVSERLAHVHEDEPFTDLARQPLLPYQLSRLGPGVTWTDVDGDGDADLLVGAGQGGEQHVLVNDDGRFSEASAGRVSHDRTTLLPAGSGAPDHVILGQTSYDASTPDEARALPGVTRAARAGAGGDPVNAGQLSSVGPLAQADVDADGDLDLFVGGRSVPAFYPLPATSRLLLNEDGAYRDAGGGTFEDLGLVSGAVFVDVDGDVDADLVLALEWGPLRAFRNDGGVFTDATEAWGLQATGLWRGVNAGDFDGDGDFDLVATNQGLNTRLQTSELRPLTLVHADVDQNGTWDPVPARARVDRGALYPLVRFEQIRVALPSVRTRVDDFEAYSRAPLSEVLGIEPDRLFQLRAETLEHTVFINEGGAFRARPLPALAQLAPAHHVGVSDLDGDGDEDLLITQNFFPTDGFTPRYDSGRGLVLLGDGTGSFEPMPGLRSGVVAYGDQRGAAFSDFDADGRVDVAIGQHGWTTKLFRNVSATPGLRVRLVGPEGNPDGVGALLRVVYETGEGPAREVRAGAGYWSSDDPVQVLGLSGEPRGILVRWPDGTVTDVPLEAGARRVTVRWSGS